MSLPAAAKALDTQALLDTSCWLAEQLKAPPRKAHQRLLLLRLTISKLTRMEQFRIRHRQH
jgi:hypothetical protein